MGKSVENPIRGRCPILAIFARSVFHIASRGFYARQDTKTPFIISIVAVGLSTILAVLFSIWDFGPEGLGWAQSIGAVLEITLLLAILNRKSGHQLFNREFIHAFFKMIFASLITGCVAYSFTKFFPLRSTDNSVFITVPKFALISIVSAIAYVISCSFLGLPEVKPIIEKVKRTLFKNV